MADFDLSATGKSLIAVGRAPFKELAENQFYNTVRLWDVETGRLRRSFRSKGSEWMDARSVFFSADEHYVMLHEGCEGGCWQGNLRVWEANQEDELAEIRFDPPSDRFRFSPYEKTKSLSLMIIESMLLRLGETCRLPHEEVRM